MIIFPVGLSKCLEKEEIDHKNFLLIVLITTY